MTMHQQPVLFSDISGHQSQGLASVENLDFRARLKRASVRGGVFMLAAFVGIFVPFLHFVITPAFFLVSIAAFVITMRQYKIVPSVTGTCPACGKPIEFQKLKYGGVQKDACSSCRQILKITISP